MPLISVFAALAMMAAPDAAPVQLPVLVGGRAVVDDDSLVFGWPGSYFEARFRGDAVTVSLESETEHMRLLVDGAEKAALRRPGGATLTLHGFGDGDHVVRLEKQTESQTGHGRLFGFFVSEPSESLQPLERAHSIEFIGDSYTVGYGNISPKRSCTKEEVHDLTDTQQAFGPLVAKRLDAEYRINAYSGFGIVRNYNGGVPELSLPIIYPRLIPEDATLLEQGVGDWHPQLIVINLGTNDFSTPLHAGERWRDDKALRADYRNRYIAFARELMHRQPQAQFILMGSDPFYSEVEKVAAELNRTGGKKVTTVAFGNLDRGGCDWHPSLADHRMLADLLLKTIGTLPQPLPAAPQLRSLSSASPKS